MEAPFPVQFIGSPNPGHPIPLETFLVRNEHFINTTLTILGTVIDVIYCILLMMYNFFLHLTLDT